MQNKEDEKKEPSKGGFHYQWNKASINDYYDNNNDEEDDSYINTQQDNEEKTQDDDRGRHLIFNLEAIFVNKVL